MNKRKQLKSIQYFLKSRIISIPYILKKSQSSKVLINSYPKAGTHLLLSCFELLKEFPSPLIYHIDPDYRNSNRLLSRMLNGQVISGHFFYSDELIKHLQLNSIKTLFIIRDLRDIAVSNFYYITYKDKTHRLHKYFKSLPNDEARLLAAIEGVEAKDLKQAKGMPSIGDFARNYQPWVQSKDCLTLKFEDLVGVKGGGTNEVMEFTLEQIFNYLEISDLDHKLEFIKENLFNTNSKTFRSGQIGNWKKHFKALHIEAFKKEAGDLLIDLGYENDINW